MTRSDYLEAVDRSLDFMGADARGEVLADMAELYDGLAGRGMTDEEVQRRIGTPPEVAREYRLAEELDRFDRAPGAAAGMRMGFQTLTGRIARGAALQLVGLVWFTLAILSLAFLVLAVAGVALAATVLAGYDPVATTLAVPGIPVVSGVLLGLAAAAAAVSLLLGNRLLMRALSRLLRRRVLGRPNADDRFAGRPASGTRPPPDGGRDESARNRWNNAGNAVRQTALVALAMSVVAAVLYPVVPAHDYPLVVDESQLLHLDGVETVELVTRDVDIRLLSEDTPRVRVTGNLRRTFLQRVDLRVTRDGSTLQIHVGYRQGLDWGINPVPVAEVVVPERVAVTISHRAGGEIDLAGLPESMRTSVEVRRSE